MKKIPAAGPAPFTIFSNFLNHTGSSQCRSTNERCMNRPGGFFLIKNDEVIKIMKKHTPDISIRAGNPLRWFMELNHDGE
jgi:hypothetical protein